MPIDPSIPLQAKNVQFESPVNQLVMLSEATKLGEMNRNIEEQNRLNEYLKGADLTNPAARTELMKYGKTGLAYGKALAEQEKLGMETKKLGYETKGKQLDVQREQFANLVFNPSDANITAHLQDSVLKGELPEAQAGQMLQKVMGMNLDQRKQFFTDMGMKAAERAQLAETTRSHKVNEGISAGHLQVARQDLANKYDPTIQSNLAAAKAGGETTGKAVATARINLPTVIANAEDAINVIDQMIGKPAVYKDGKLVQAGTKPHAGFQDYVGATLKPGARFIEGTNAAGYEAFQKQLEGKAFTEAFDTLRGGGSITEKEGEKATAAKLRMSKAQNEKEYMEAAREYQGIVRKGVERAKAKAAGGGAAPAGGEIDFNSLK